MKTNYKGKAIAFSCISAYLLFLSMGAYGNGDLPLFVLLLVVIFILVFFAIRNFKKQKELNDANSYLLHELDKIKPLVFRGNIPNYIPPNEILAAVDLYVKNNEKVLDDCIRLVSETSSPKIFFDRYDLLVVRINNLLAVENVYFDFKRDLHRLKYTYIIKRASIVSNMIDRMWDKTIKSTYTLSTVKGKENKFNAFFRNIAVYEARMPEDSWKYVQELKRMYLDNKELMTKVVAVENI